MSQLVTLTVPMKDLKMAILMVNLMEHSREPQMVRRLDIWKEQLMDLLRARGMELLREN